jgi:AcrR family transcriptional regulator
MPRKRQVEVNEATRRRIKDVACELIAEKGTAGLSLRAIARKMAMTAPALYHYFDSLDDLITALIVDAFTGQAAYIRQARDAAAEAGQSYGEQIFTAMLAYRQWAVEHVTDFQLIYGNPIPGYDAPADVTTPAAQLIGDVFMETVSAGVEAKVVQLPENYTRIPPLVYKHYQTKYGMDEEVARIFHVLNQTWGLIHGMVSLEVHNHTTPVVGDTQTFYEQAVRAHLQTFNVTID